MAHVTDHFPLSEQKKFNDGLLSTLSSRKVRVAAVAFREAIDTRKPKATDRDRNNFQKRLSSVMRRFAIPFWKGQLSKTKSPFLKGKRRAGKVQV